MVESRIQTEPLPPDPLLAQPVGRAVFRMGLPLALGMASHALINLVDLALVGRLGQDAILVAHVASTINFVPMVVGNGISIALLSQLSRLLGRGETRKARAFHRQSEWFMLWFGLAVSVLSALPAALCVDSVGLQGQVRTDAIHFLVVSNLGCVAMFVMMQTTAAMRAVGETAAPVAVLLGANVLNLGLNIVLLFGYEPLGIPSFGVVGAAYGTVAARTVAALGAWAWLLRARHPLTLRRTEADPPKVAVAWPLLRDAAPQAGQIGLRALLLWGLTVIGVRQSGAEVGAALGITTRLDTMVLFAAVGFASAATTIAGRAVAVGDERRARAAGHWAAAQACIFGAVLIATFWTLAKPIVLVFLPDASNTVVAAATLYLGVAALAQPLGAIALGAMGAVHGAGRMMAPLVIDLAGFAILGGLLLIAAFTSPPEYGLVAVYWALVAGSGVLALLHLAFLEWARWPRPLAESAGAPASSVEVGVR